MKQTLFHDRYAKICAALLAADIVVFTRVNPVQASAPWLIIGYALLGLTLFGITGLLASSLKSYGERPHAIGKRALRYGVIITMMLIGLQSVGQLTVRDVLTLLPFAAVGYLYLGYGKKMTPE